MSSPLSFDEVVGIKLLNSSVFWFVYPWSIGSKLFSKNGKYGVENMPMKKTTILIVSLIFVLMIKTPYFGSIFILIINQPSIFKGKF